MPFLLRTQWVEDHEHTHERLQDAVSEARTLVTDGKAASVAIEGEGLFVSVSLATRPTEPK